MQCGGFPHASWPVNQQFRSRLTERLHDAFDFFCAVGEVFVLYHAVDSEWISGCVWCHRRLTYDVKRK